FGQQRRGTPTIEDRVMENQHELKFIVAAADDVKTVQRRLLIVEVQLLFLFQPLLYGDSKLLGREMTQIFKRDIRGHTLVHELKRNAEPAQVERSAQLGMARDSLVNGLRQHVLIEPRSHAKA